MKKTCITVLFAMLLVLLCACTPPGDGTDTTSDTTIPVTSPDGFEDVTAPPVADTTDAKAEDTTDSKIEDTTEAEKTEDTTASEGITDADSALAKARAWLGESDPDTGYKYAFSYDGMMTEGGVDCYKIRVSWYIEEQERYSLCGYLLVSPDGKVSKYSW